jgi:acyl-CoA reductase-like NAD-dependent aldehyde dehydrogenase
VDVDAKDLEHVTDRIVFGAFYQSGQSCISVQRVYIHEAIFDKVKSMLIEKTKKLKMGNPMEEDTFVGPVISEHDAKRIDTWVHNAVKHGSKVLVGGNRHGVVYGSTFNLKNNWQNPPSWKKSKTTMKSIAKKFSGLFAS